MKKKSSKFLTQNSHFFRGIWRSLNPSSCLLLACNWLKYNYGTFSKSLGVAKHVRIGLKNIKNFCWNKSFHRNFWLKFDISHEAITRKVPSVPTLSVKKNFLRPQIKKFGIKYPSIITHPKTVWGIQTPKTLPATYFISPEGEIVFTSLKPQDEASLSLIYEDLQNGA